MFHVKHLNTIETRGRFKVKFGHPLQIATKLHNQICLGAVQIEAHKKCRFSLLNSQGCGQLCEQLDGESDDSQMESVGKNQ